MASEARDPITKIIAEFIEIQPLLLRVEKKVAVLIEELLASSGLRVHSVTSRVKRREKFEEKLQRVGKNYESLNQVTDQLGFRVITYYGDEVDIVEALLRAEFEVDHDNSIDKRIQDDPEKFTYASLHLVCSLGKARLSLREYVAFDGIKFEIQIRSILQHAWAEIEHDSYDMQSTLPKDIKRRFSRLSGLLDLADSEFQDIRRKKLEYERSVSLLVEAEVPDISDVPLDELSLAAFVEQDSLLQRLDAEASRVRGIPLRLANVGGIVKLSLALGIKSLQELRESLNANREGIRSYIAECAPLWRDSQATSLLKGVSVLYLCMLLFGDLTDAAVAKILSDSHVKEGPNFAARMEVSRKIRKSMLA